MKLILLSGLMIIFTSTSAIAMQDRKPADERVLESKRSMFNKLLECWPGLTQNAVQKAVSKNNKAAVIEDLKDDFMYLIIYNFTGFDLEENPNHRQWIKLENEERTLIMEAVNHVYGQMKAQVSFFSTKIARRMVQSYLNEKKPELLKKFDN